MSETRSNRAALQHQRDAVADSLTALEKRRAEAVQMISFAQARERAGVAEETPVDAPRLAADEAAAHAAMRDARAELHRLDMALESQPRPGFGEKLGNALGRLRRGGDGPRSPSQ